MPGVAVNERLARVTHRFPLVPRVQPPQLPIRERISEVARLAATPPGHPDHASRIAAAHNLAALIASDAGEREFARALCWLHHDRYSDQRPWDAITARRALEPLVNLARLHIRDRATDCAVAVLESLLDATRRAGTAQVDHRPIYLGYDALTSADARRGLHRWLWTVVVTEGIRALVRADRWDDALAHAHRHRGIGDTLLDGRQAAVIAHALRGEPDTARATLDGSTISSSWQQAVKACLTLAIQGDANPSGRVSDVALRAVTRCSEAPIQFRLHLVLTLADLGRAPSDCAEAIHELAGEVVESGDASAAGIVLQHLAYEALPDSTQMAVKQTQARDVTSTDIAAQLCVALNLLPHAGEVLFTERQSWFDTADADSPTAFVRETGRDREALSEAMTTSLGRTGERSDAVRRGQLLQSDRCAGSPAELARSGRGGGAYGASPGQAGTSNVAIPPRPGR